MKLQDNNKYAYLHICVCSLENWNYCWQGTCSWNLCNCLSTILKWKLHL